MPYRVVATEILDDTDRVVFDALDNKRIRRELCKWMNKAEAAEARIFGLDRGLAKSDEIIAQLEAERDELRHKLNEAMGIARGFVAERDEARKQLEQARDEQERLRRFLQTIVNLGDKEHHAAFDGERWREMRHCANQALQTNNDLWNP